MSSLGNSMVRQSNKQSEEHKSNDASTMTELATSLKENKFPQKTVSVSEKKDMKNTKKLEGAELIAELRRVVEEAFERDNLSNNHLLVSKMNAQMYVPISVVMEMESVRELSVSDEDLLKKAIEGSKTCVVNESGDMIKPSFKVERNTIILRDVPVDTTEKDIRDVFTGLGKIKEVRSDVGDTWFVTMEDEETAKEAVLKLRLSGAKIKDSAVKARLKSANLLRALSPPPSTSGSRSIGTNYSDKDFKGVMPMYPQTGGSYYMPPYMARMPMYPGPFPFGVPPQQQQQRFNNDNKGNNNNHSKNKNNNARSSGHQTQSYGHRGSNNSSRRTSPSDGRKRQNQGGKQYTKDRSNNNNNRSGGRFNGKYYDREMQQKNRARGQHSRSNNNSSNNNSKDNNNRGTGNHNRGGSRKGYAKGNFKNNNKKSVTTAKVTETAVVAPDMSATNFPSLVSAPADTVDNSTSESRATSPSVTKASGWASVLKKTTNVTKSKKKSVSPKTKSTSSSSSSSKVTKKNKSSGSKNKSSSKPAVSESKNKNIVSEKSKPRPRRGWEKTDELKKAKEAARRAREEELKRKAQDDESKKSTDRKQEEATLKSKTVVVSDKKDDESAVMEKSASGWGAKKSFAAILKEKKAAAAERRASSDDEDSKPKSSSWSKSGGADGEDDWRKK